MSVTKEKADLESLIVDLSYWLLARRFAARTCDELHPRDEYILELLVRNTSLPFSAITGAFGAISDSAISSAISLMEDRDWVKKTHSNDDQRTKIITITKAGRNEIDAFRQKLHGRMNAMFVMVGLTDEERKSCEGIVRRACEKFACLEKL